MVIPPSLGLLNLLLALPLGTAFCHFQNHSCQDQLVQGVPVFLNLFFFTASDGEMEREVEVEGLNCHYFCYPELKVYLYLLM